MSTLLIAFALATLVLLIVDRILKLLRSKRHRRIPGPIFRWPFVGHRPLLRAKGGLGKATMSLAKEYDTDVVGLYIAGEYAVTACSPSTVKEIFSKSEFQGRPHTYFTYLRSMKTNKGITMTNGHHWQEQRTFLVKQLSELGFGRDRMNQMIEDSLRAIVKDLGEGGPEVDLSSIVSKSVINILWKIVTDKEISDQKLTELTELMHRRSKAFDQSGGWLAQMPWLRHILPEWTGYNTIVKINQELRKIITDAIDEHKETYKKEVTRSFIDAFLHKMYESKPGTTTFDDDQLMMLCMDLFIGGIMTTSNSLDFCFLRMVHHPDVQSKAQKELDSVLGTRLPNIDDRKGLPYTSAVIAESLRMTMIAPVNGPRIALTEATLGEYTVPKGTLMFMNMDPVSLDEKNFPEADKFKPERYLDANENTDENSNAALSYPFGFGKRRCPGEVLARNYMFIILSGILHEYKLAPPRRRPCPSLEPNIGITHTPKPYRLSLEKRNTSRIDCY